MKLFKLKVTNEIEKWRYETFWTKEPETIEFIKSFIHKFDNTDHMPVFLDIGANIGIYSLYAAYLYSGLMQIISIEPDILNYRSLIENIQLNKFYNITPLNIGIYSNIGIRYFGNEENELTEAGASVNKIGKYDKALNILTLTIDSLYEIFGHIDFLKIDVDDAEYEILFGARKSLSKIDSMLIEFDKKDQRFNTVIEFVEDQGFTRDNYFNKLANHSRFRRKEEGNDNIENIIFTKA